MKTRSILSAAALVALLAAGARSAYADDDGTYWPSDQEDQLSTVGNEIIAVMREQRQARFENNEAKLKQLDERMKKLNEEKIELLRKMGELQ